MEEHIREIKQIATKYTENRYDGYSQIIKICDAVLYGKIVTVSTIDNLLKEMEDED